MTNTFTVLVARNGLRFPAQVIGCGSAFPMQPGRAAILPFRKFPPERSGAFEKEMRR